MLSPAVSTTAELTNATSFPHFRVPPSGHVIWAPYQYHVTYQYHATIPYYVILYHTKVIPGCLGSFFKIYTLLLQAAGCNTGPLGAIFCGKVLHVFPKIFSYKWRLVKSIHWKSVQMSLIPAFSMHQKPFNDTYLSQSFNQNNVQHKQNNTTSIVMMWSLRSKDILCTISLEQCMISHCKSMDLS